MLSNRWEKIEQLFNEALIVPISERSSFVKQVCGADDDLCFEVTSLLEADDHSDEILEQSVFPLIARIIDDDFSHLLEKSDFASYKLKRLLGRGGMGVVFLAEDTRLERFVALKILSASVFASNAELAAQFEREAKVASSVSHQNVAHIYEFGKNEGMYFFAMEYIPGKTLRELINEEQIEVLNAVDIAMQTARALEAAHSKQIVHRDIKPENIMLRQRAVVTEEVLVKVLDFGIAKSNERNLPEKNISYEFAPESVIGTIAYMSPEQVRGEIIDKRTDVWSLGVVLYELLTGIHPFKGSANSDTVKAILEAEPLSPKSLNPAIPAELERIALKMLQKKREDRFQTADEVHARLQELKRALDAEKNSRTLQKQNVKSYFVEKRPYQMVLYTGLIVLLFIACGYKLWNFNSEETNQIQHQPIKSVAVLPFQIQSSSQEREYLSDGITESIINRLSQLPELSVKARSSVFQYKGKDINPQKTSQELSVQALLIGHITESGDNLTINLELVDGKTGNQIWGNRYEQKGSNLVSLENEILRDVSNKLQTRFAGTGETDLSKSDTRNGEAYQLYLKGRFYWNKRTASDLLKSTEYYNQAIALDPNFALAYSGLADSYVLFSGYGAATPQESFPKAKEAAKKALEIDETLPEAHAALGYVLFNYDWNFEESEKHMKRALELNPNYAVAHNWYGNANLLAAGQFDEAIEELKQAQRIDPLSIIMSADLGNSYLFARRNDEAIEQFRKTIEMDKNFYYAHTYLGRAYMMKGLFKEALFEFEKARALGDDPRILMLMACNYSKMGKKAKAQLILNQLKEMSSKRYVSAYYFAIVYTALGEKDEAFRWLEKAFQDHEGRMTLIKVDPLLDDLRSDPRFGKLIGQVGLNK